MSVSTPHNPFLEVVLAAVLTELRNHTAAGQFMVHDEITEQRRAEGYAFLAILLEAMRGAITDDMRTTIERTLHSGGGADTLWNALIDTMLGRRTSH